MDASWKPDDPKLVAEFLDDFREATDPRDIADLDDLYGPGGDDHQPIAEFMNYCPDRHPSCRSFVLPELAPRRSWRPHWTTIGIALVVYVGLVTFGVLVALLALVLV